MRRCGGEYAWGGMKMFHNMSDGKTDGLVLMYCQNGVIYPVAVRESDMQMLDITIGMSLGGRVTLIKDKPQGVATNLIIK
jgi:hypothetical protein